MTHTIFLGAVIFICSLNEIIAFAYNSSNADGAKCCEGACPDGLQKYYSIAKQYGIVGQLNCGESCIAPEDEAKYQKFEPGLTKSDVDDPCHENGFDTYIDTVTHGTPRLQATVDLYTTVDTTTESEDEKCCEGACPDGLQKYYSIAKQYTIVGQLNCGESCIAPEDEAKYQKFEPGLTKSDVDDPCHENGFDTYIDTVTHGTPRLQATVDLYTSPGACDCSGGEDVCSLIPPDESGEFPCYQGTVEDASNCYKTDPILKDGTKWICNTCASAGYPLYLRQDPIYRKMELWGMESDKSKK